MVAKKNLHWAVLPLFLLVIVNGILLRQLIGPLRDVWQGVPPSYTNDDIYYYARIREVIDGYPFLSHPFFWEHRNDSATTFFIADWLSALPGFMGLSIPITIGISILLWNFILMVLLQALLKSQTASRFMLIVGMMIAYISIYPLVLKPTVMPIVFSSYLLFYYTLYRWIASPNSSRARLLLTIASAATFYIYPYLWQLVGLTYVCLIITLVFTHRKNEALLATKIGLRSLLLGLPVIIYSLVLAGNPLYVESAERAGLVFSRLPTLSAMNYARWVIIACILWYILKPQPHPHAADRTMYTQKLFYLVTGLGLAAMLMSNLITGAELELGMHVGRFVILWLVISTVVAVEVIRKKNVTMFRRHVRTSIALLCIAVLVVGIARNLYRAVPFYLWTQMNLNAW